MLWENFHLETFSCIRVHNHCQVTQGVPIVWPGPTSLTFEWGHPHGPHANIGEIKGFFSFSFVIPTLLMPKKQNNQAKTTREACQNLVHTNQWRLDQDPHRPLGTKKPNLANRWENMLLSLVSRDITKV